MTTLQFIIALCLIVAAACKLYAVLRPHAGLHTWAWSFLWLGVFLGFFGDRVVR